VIFTSGASEANAIGLRGMYLRLKDKGRHIISTRVEHTSVLSNLCYLEKYEGAEVTYVDVDKHGMLDAEAIAAAIRPDTILISVMWVNNETGNIFLVEKIGGIAREKGIFFHCDAAQAVGKLAIDFSQDLAIDMLTFSAHKFAGPPGVGGYVLKHKMKPMSLILGGGQEKGLRSGTENLPGIVAAGKAAEIAHQQRAIEQPRIAVLGDRLLHELQAFDSSITLNGHLEKRLKSTVNLCFLGVTGESLLLALDLEGIAASFGSACSTGTLEPSHVLTAMGLHEAKVMSSLRFSLGRWISEADITRAVQIISQLVGRIRSHGGHKRVSA